MDTAKIYGFNFPTPIRFGAGAINELPDYLLAHGLNRPLLVTDPTIAELPFFKDIQQKLTHKGIDVIVFHDLHKTP